MQSIRIYEIPDCKMVSSGVGMFGDGSLEKFDKWLSMQPRGIYPKDFLYWDSSSDEKQGFNWLYVYEEGMSVPDEFPIVNFHGGLYAVATDIDPKTNKEVMDSELNIFLIDNGFERDTSRPELGNIITSPHAKETLGYEQMNYWFPIRKNHEGVDEHALRFRNPTL